MRLKPTALILEDQGEFGEALKVILRQYGLNVVSTRSRKDFWEKSQSSNPDIYFVDFTMLENEAFELVESLLKEINSTALIIAIAHDSSEEVIARAFAAGISDYFLKTVDKNHLLLRISRFVQTEELAEHQRVFTKTCILNSPATVIFDTKVTSIDEYGLVFESPHLILKDTIIYVASGIFGEIDPVPKSFALSVVHSSWNHSSQRYTITAEFTSNSEQFYNKLRAWLLRSSPQYENLKQL